MYLYIQRERCIYYYTSTKYYYQAVRGMRPCVGHWGPWGPSVAQHRSNFPKSRNSQEVLGSKTSPATVLGAPWNPMAPHGALQAPWALGPRSWIPGPGPRPWVPRSGPRTGPRSGPRSRSKVLGPGPGSKSGPGPGSLVRAPRSWAEGRVPGPGPGPKFRGKS